MSNSTVKVFRKSEVLAQAASELLLKSKHVTHIEVGVVLGFVIPNDFKATAYWYGPKGEGPTLAERIAGPVSPRTALSCLYIVDKAVWRPSHLWHRIRLPDLHYLRPMRRSDTIKPDLRLFKTRDLFV